MVMSSRIPAVSDPIFIHEALELTIQLVIVMLLQDSSGERLFRQMASSPLLIKQLEILANLQSTISKPSVFRPGASAYLGFSISLFSRLSTVIPSISRFRHDWYDCTQEAELYNVTSRTCTFSHPLK